MRGVEDEQTHWCRGNEEVEGIVHEDSQTWRWRLQFVKSNGNEKCLCGYELGMYCLRVRLSLPLRIPVNSVSSCGMEPGKIRPMPW